MNNPVSPKILWNKAAKNGIALGLFTALCRMVSQFVTSTDIPSAGTAVLNGLVWLIQFAGCIWIMKFLMERLVTQYDGVTGRDTARYGRLLALSSSLIFSAVMLADVLFISPETVTKQMDLLYEMYGSMIDTNTRATLQAMENAYPQIMFFSTFIYSWLYGVILSAILSRSIPRRDPFDSFMTHNRNEQ